MTAGSTGAAYADDLRDLLGLGVPPIAITFAAAVPADVPGFGGTMPAPTADGRTGVVSAGCVFWMRGTERTFSTVAADHANCSVGSYTHGFKALADVVGNADVQALLSVGWVSPEAAMQIPTLANKPEAVVYGPLAEAGQAPDIVFLRINGKQLMLLNDAWPALRFEGKPQCHIIPVALNTGEVTVSSGCMLSRVRTGMSNNEVTCAIPWTKLPDLIEKLKQAGKADYQAAAYAADDAKRFA